MMRRLFKAGTLAFVLAAAQGTEALAQWGYPDGLRRLRLGRLGRRQTVQGSIARGMGAYAAGAGYYNQQTAVAKSINADTVMRWNQYVYESQMNANRLHHGKLARERYNNIKDVDKVQKRLRDNPEPADIFQRRRAQRRPRRDQRPAGSTPRPCRGPRRRSAARRSATSPSSMPPRRSR